MTVPEFHSWCVYRRKRGSLNLGRRIEQASAATATMTAALAGVKNVSVMDFMPHEKEDAANLPKKELTLEEAMKEWQ